MLFPKIKKAEQSTLSKQKGEYKLPTVDKILQEVMSGSKDRNIKFSELQKLLESLDFKCRIKGDHFIYYKNGIDEIVNIQPYGNKSKAYQVKQVRNIILKYYLEV